MKLKNSYFFTLRENVKDEDSNSSNLLARAGMIKKTSAGVYMLLPLGLKVMQKIENIIREEMNQTGCQEVRMPALISEDVYVASGRRDNFGKSMFSLKDRNGKPFVLGPTHEELFAQAAGLMIQSYKDMPFSLYQFETKFRDEPRPRFGLVRTREFVMKDAYTFDVDEKGLDEAYAKQFQAYKNIFDRLGIVYKIVQADTGVMGGLLSEEFQAVCPMGEDTLVLCDSCDMASNQEVAPCVNQPEEKPSQLETKEEVLTPNAGTIEEVCAYLKKPAERFVKTLIYQIDGKPYGVCIRGNREVNETKLRILMQANSVELADAGVVEEVTHAKVGFAGPIGLGCPVLEDEEVAGMYNFIVGANKTDNHLIGVNNTDFQPLKVADLRNIQEGDTCPHCGGKIVFQKGIEVGNTFKLGTKYSQAMNLYYLGADNQNHPVWMGSYGIGLARTMQALVEQRYDEHGIAWPLSVAPFQVALVQISDKDEEQNHLAQALYDALQKAHIDVLFDDRDERPGVKFKDMELIGIPYRVTVGKLASEGKVEFKGRSDTDNQVLTVEEVLQKLESCLHV